MNDELHALAGCLKTYLEFHGRGHFFLPHSPETSEVASMQIQSSEKQIESFASFQDSSSVSSSPPPTNVFVSDDKIQNIHELKNNWGACTRCKLAQGRTHLVFGEGATPADLMFIGEGPGEQEDLQGRPFVGKAGELLTRMIEAMGLRRENVYIANIVKCRPPNNRDPEPDEIEACMPVLLAQIRCVRPRVIVSLGKISAQTLLGTAIPISRLRGKWHQFQGIDLMPTFHPAYLLRSPDKKKEAWMDLQAVIKQLGEPHAPKRNE